MAYTFVAFDDMGSSGIKLHRDVVEQLAATNDNLTIDMSKVTHLDGSGIGALVYMKRRLKEHGHDVQIINVTGQPSQMLEDLGVAKLLGTA